MNVRVVAAAVACGVLVASSGCTLPGGASASRPGGATASTPTMSTPSATPTATPSPTPSITPSPLPATVPASPGATLAVLPDARSGAALDAPLLVRGLPLINASHGVSKVFAPKVGTDYQLEPEAEQAFARLIAAAKKDGAAIIWRVGYRSYDTQAQLLATPPTPYGDDAGSYIAKPGHSEHQAGLAVDVASEKGYGTRFPETKEFAWLRANSHKFGFILRYPDGKTDITGVNYEPWHYRYIGVQAALAFGPSSSLTLEEYLGGR